ncbi:alpha/beta hydrolase [Gordonia sp. NPDC003376]
MIVLMAVAGSIHPGAARAWGPPPKDAKTFRQDRIDGYGMGDPLVRTWAAVGVDVSKAPTIVFLDGLRARNDFNGWEIDTNVAYLSKRGYNVVMPVGGESSFYADWTRASTSAGQKSAYRWESVLTKSLPAYLDKRGFHNRTLVGLSMSGSQAVMIANDHRDKYARAVSIAGMLHPTATCPISSVTSWDAVTYTMSQLKICALGMQGLLRLAALDAGRYNLDDMWGFYPNTRALDNDPTLQLLQGKLRGLHLWVYSGNGVWGDHQPRSDDALTYYKTGLDSSAIELLAKAQSKNFADLSTGLDSGVTLRTHFPATGTHAWGYWEEEIWYIASQGWFKNG